MKYSYYFAGGLFNHKDIVGNLLLSEKVYEVSVGKYESILPQNLEAPEGRAEQIRNNDISALLKADLAIFNFDGSELDSGTVVEFMIAKMVDMPCVLLRTDFRSGGDQGPGKDQWNLMCSSYPRSATLIINSMQWYHDNFSKEGYSTISIGTAYNSIAKQIIGAFDVVISQPTIIAGESITVADLYKWAVKFPGGELTNLITEQDINEIVNKKIAKGLYS